MKLSRRSVLALPGLLAACAPRLARRFNGYCFVANQGDRTVACVNLTRFKVEKKFQLESAPASILGLPGTRLVLAFSPANATVTEIDADSLSVSRRRRAGISAIQMLLSPDNSRVWMLTAEPRALIPIGLRTFRSETPLTLPAVGSGFDIDPTGRLAAVAFPTLKTAAIVDLVSGRIVHSIDTAGEPGPIRFRTDSKQILIANPSARTILIAETATGRPIVTLPLAIAPERFCFGAGGGQMFVSGQGMDAIAIVYPYRTVVSETILAGRDPGAMAVNDSQLFVANPGSGDVTVIDIENRQVMAKIPVGQEPVSISITPDNEYMLVLNRKSCDMAVVRLVKISDPRYKRAGLFTIVPVGDSPVSAAICHL